MTFGTYPSVAPADTTDAVSDSYKGQGIRWLVLSVDQENKRALVISEKVLFCMRQYTNATTSNNTTYTYKWSDSDINTYLNGDFITDYGLGDVSMANVEHETETYTFADSSSSGVAGTATTSSEKVFLLSIAEANTYFADKTERKAYPLTGTGTTAKYWWLRSQAYGNSYRGAAVGSSGTIDRYGQKIESSIGVRPAFWVNL
jgi:hypothetical protein